MRGATGLCNSPLNETNFYRTKLCWTFAFDLFRNGHNGLYLINVSYVIGITQNATKLKVIDGKIY